QLIPRQVIKVNVDMNFTRDDEFHCENHCILYFDASLHDVNRGLHIFIYDKSGFTLPEIK
ncbi:TPA: hypothetical protein ACS6CP_004092, partial [Escherichia coli]